MRLARFPAARFLLGDFKSEDWCEALHPPYSAVVAMQAVHEIRHKRHVPRLYQQIRSLVEPTGCLLVCDHVPNDGSLRATSLNMTAQEQLVTLSAAGFTDARIDLEIERMYLADGMRPAA